MREILDIASRGVSYVLVAIMMGGFFLTPQHLSAKETGNEHLHNLIVKSQRIAKSIN